ncbi:MAG: hypothetical protein PF448_11070 [Bacteroidales bacterium]|jgi:hypothetical protein|nr:hypothetical protein [Bacteroidales bacterium]
MENQSPSTNQNQSQHSQQTQENTRTVYVQQAPSAEKNGLGTAGFILALISLFFGWIPIFGWIIWVLGLIFSFIGIFKKPRGLAIAGLIISVVDIILILFVFAALGIAATLL